LIVKREQIMNVLRKEFPSIVGLLIALMVISCDKESSDSDKDSAESVFFTSNAIANFTDVDGLAEVTPIIPTTLQDTFCSYALKLPLKSDFSAEVDFLCDDGVPNDNFRNFDRLGQLSGDSPRSIKLFSQELENNVTEAVYGTATRVSIVPKIVRLAPIQSFITKNSTFDDVKIEGSITTDMTDSLGGDLQFSKFELKYNTAIDTGADKVIENSHATEFNNYQVQGGNPNIGLGTEHLIGESNGDFKTYNVITITIADGVGGSFLISLIHVVAHHHGFSDLIQRSTADIASSQGTHLYRGVSAFQEGQ